jgi:uncharacterized RDD family membrane protein YckC
MTNNEVGFSKRFLALLADYIVIFLAFIVIGLVISFVAGILRLRYGSVQENLIVVVTMIFIFFYYSHAFKKEGQTVGEKLMKIKLVPLAGGKISLLSGIMRVLFVAPLLAILGFIYISRNPRRTINEHFTRTNTCNA